MAEQRRGGGFSPPAIDYSVIVARRIDESGIAIRSGDPGAFACVEELYDLLESYLDAKERGEIQRIYLPEYDLHGEGEGPEVIEETVCEMIDRKYAYQIEQTYEMKKSTDDITSGSWNKSMRNNIETRYGIQADVEKARILRRALLNTKACRKVTRERTTWVGVD